MDISKINLPLEMVETLDAMFKKAKKIKPDLTESIFIERVFDDWMEPYKREKERLILPKNKVILKNSLRQAIKLCGKSITTLSEEIGLSRTYLGMVVNGKSEPSITVVLLIAQALNYPPEKLHELFYLEPVSKE